MVFRRDFVRGTDPGTEAHLVEVSLERLLPLVVAKEHFRGARRVFDAFGSLRFHKLSIDIEVETIVRRVHFKSDGEVPPLAHVGKDAARQ